MRENPCQDQGRACAEFRVAHTRVTLAGLGQGSWYDAGAPRWPSRAEKAGSEPGLYVGDVA
jgi:hypothetical protein